MALVALSCASSGQDTVYFVMGYTNSEGNGGTVVLPMADPASIVKARGMISSTNGPYAVVTLIRGGDGINRDYSREGAPPWSWHLVSIVRFGEFGRFSCAPWVGIGIENDVRLPDTGPPDGSTLFGNFAGHFGWCGETNVYGTNAAVTVPIIGSSFAEAGPTPILTARPATRGIQLNWTQLLSPTSYTLEYTDSLGSTNWTTPTDVTWPAFSATYTDTSIRTNRARFYRLKTVTTPDP